jgi:hypothetical protein
VHEIELVDGWLGHRAVPASGPSTSKDLGLLVTEQPVSNVASSRLEPWPPFEIRNVRQDLLMRSEYVNRTFWDKQSGHISGLILLAKASMVEERT